MLVTDSCCPARYFCDSCGAEMPLWFGVGDRGFEEWLWTPCRRCGSTPRQRRQKGTGGEGGYFAAAERFTAFARRDL